MPTTIPLQITAHQSVSVRADGARYDITLTDIGGMMAATIARDGVTLLSGARLVAGMPLLPYGYLAEGGNFFFLTEGDAPPWWEDFGTQTLAYLTAQEIAAP